MSEEIYPVGDRQLLRHPISIIAMKKDSQRFTMP